MPTYAQQMNRLKRIIILAEKVIAETQAPKIGRPAKANGATKVNDKGNGKKKRVRRKGKELIAFRNMLKAERKKGVSVSALAKKHSVSSAYIYQL